MPRWTRLLGVAAIPAAALVDLTPELSKARLGVTALIWSLFWGAGLYAQVYRYRHVSGPVQRQQTKWVALAFGVLSPPWGMVGACWRARPPPIGLFQPCDRIAKGPVGRPAGRRATASLRSWGALVRGRSHSDAVVGCIV